MIELVKQNKNISLSGKELLRGEKGESGVYVGTTEPTDPDMLVWINPEGEESAELATKEYVDEAIAKALAGGGSLPNGNEVRY